jgi:hypothetical protein
MVVRSPALMFLFNVSPTEKVNELSLENDDKPSRKFITPAWYELLSFLVTFAGAR